MNAGVDALEVRLDGRVAADLTINRRRVPQLRYREDFIAAHEPTSARQTGPLRCDPRC